MTGVRGWVSAGLAGLLLGVVIVGALRTAPTWARALDIAPTGGTAPGPGQLRSCAGGGPACVDPATVPAAVQTMARLVAGIRERAGCTTPPTLDARLGTAAQQHADALAAGGRPSHLDAQQRTPQDRAASVGYPWPVVETLAVGLSDPMTTVEVWLDQTVDPTIIGRLTDCTASDLGVGRSANSPGGAFGSGVWVLLQGHPAA